MKTFGIAALSVLVLGLPASAQLIDPGYHDHAEANAELLALETTYPTLAKRFDLNAMLGAPLTHEGRTTYALKVSDDVLLDEDEPVALVTGNIHAREVINVEVCLDLAERLLSGYGVDPGLTAVVDAFEVWIVPTLNPDGLDFVHQVDPNWRKNRRNNGDGTFGVDLNRNFPFQWNACGTTPSTSTSSIYYIGPAPGSEPETQLALALLAALRPAKMFDFHSRGREIFFRYGCTTWPAALTLVHQSSIGLAAALMNYDGPLLSSSGGMLYKQAIRDHHSLGCLVETWDGPNWWPPYPTALAEVNQVWPGLRHLMELPIPITGHVVDAQTGEGLESIFNITGILDPSTQARSSAPGNGRFHAWLPAGGWSLNFQSNGYFNETLSPVSVVTGQTTDVTVALDPDLDLTVGTPHLGTSVLLIVEAPASPLQPYILAASLGTMPGIPLPDGRIIPLNPDPLFFLSLGALPPFGGFAGALGPTGVAFANLTLPADPAFLGFTFHLGFVVLGPFSPASLGVRHVGPSVPVTIVP